MSISFGVEKCTFLSKKKVYNIIQEALYNPVASNIQNVMRNQTAQSRTIERAARKPWKIKLTFYESNILAAKFYMQYKQHSSLKNI